MRSDTYTPKSAKVREQLERMRADPKRIWTHAEIAKAMGIGGSPSVVAQWLASLISHRLVHYQRPSAGAYLYRAEPFDSIAATHRSLAGAAGAPQPAASARPPEWVPAPMTAPRAGSDARLPKTAPGAPPAPLESRPDARVIAIAPVVVPTAEAQSPADAVSECFAAAELPPADPAQPIPFKATIDTDGRLLMWGVQVYADGTAFIEGAAVNKLANLLAWRHPA